MTTKNLYKKELTLSGLNCAHCAQKIEDSVKKLEGVSYADLNFIKKTLSIELNDFKNKEIITDDVIKKINSIEPGLSIKIKGKRNNHGHEPGDMEGSELNKIEIIRLILGVVVYIFGLYVTLFQHKTNMYIDTLFIVAYLVIGIDVLYKAVRNLVRGSVLDENFLMSIATIGAIAVGEFPEAVGVMLFYKIGEMLQDLAVGKSRNSISALMEIRPDYANLKLGSDIKVVTPEDVEVGDIIVVRPGERVPLDGVIEDGVSMLDTSAITGESVLTKVQKGDPILSGVINEEELLLIKVKKSAGESTVSKILDLVENASSKKAPTENFISKFSRYYTPAVVIIAIIVAFLPPLILRDISSLRDWIYRGLIFLVVSCPCALVLSIPLTFFSGIGLASKNGILIKGSNYLEALRNVDTIVFDKTGTLTKGVFNVTKVDSVGMSQEELVQYAAIAESNSNHPIAKSIMKYYGKTIDNNKVRSYKEIAAHGIEVKYDSKVILAGNEKLMKKSNISYRPVNEVGTVVYIAMDSKFLGSIVISDEVKEDSKKAIKELKSIGIKEVVMLTGDNENVAKNISKKLGIDKFYANLLPHEKVKRLEEIYANKSDDKKVVFVGDGINDAPVLARADIGIAMGGVGSDAAIEAADVVLMKDEPSKISKSMKISIKTNKIVWQNIVFALTVKVIVMILGAVGMANMWEAVFADVGVALISVANAMRAMR